MTVPENGLLQLNQIECQLKLASLWSEALPTEHQLGSRLPFSLDLLAPEEWLQWVFIPQIREQLIRGEQVGELNILPYFVQHWGTIPQRQALLSAIEQFEQVS